MGHQVYIDEELKSFDFKEVEDHNILDFLEDKGLEMHSHCRAGFCGPQVRYDYGSIKDDGSRKLSGIYFHDAQHECIRNAE